MPHQRKYTVSWSRRYFKTNKKFTRTKTKKKLQRGKLKETNIAGDKGLY